MTGPRSPERFVQSGRRASVFTGPFWRGLGSLLGALLLLSAASSSAAPIISEFLASNTSTHPDEDGDFPDWIEIHNPDAAPVELGGHFLTDNASQRTKWRLPAITLNPGGFLVVFASGKNRAVAGSPLHTNFSLSADGEYLALVAPDGATILHAFAPAYPKQFADVSYGRGLSAGVITTASPILTGHTARFLVPKTGAPDGDWRLPDFDDSHWNPAATGLGFGYPGFAIGAGGDLTAAMRTAVHGSVYVRLPFQIANPAAVISMTLRMKVDDGFVAYLNGQLVASKNAPTPAVHDSLATAGTEVEPGDAFESYTVNFPGHLQAGPNILAIHGMNLTHSGSDFLLLPELDVRLQDLSTGMVDGYFDTPTPGAPNTSAIPGYIKDTQFSVTRGFFTSPFPLEITTETPGVEIRYTTDGSTPTESHGQIYTGPLTIDRSTTLQAAAFRSGYRPTNVDTQTYLFLADVERQPVRTMSYWDFGMDPNVVNTPGLFTVSQALADIPTLSIVMEPDDLFGATAGIYTHATKEAAIDPFWEKKCSAEYFYHPDYQGIYRVGAGFQIDCGIAISGNFSRLTHNPKHSFRLKFKRDYGSSRLEFPLFPTSPVDEYDTLTIRTGHNQGWATNIANTDMLRDQHSRDIQGFDPAQAVSDGNHIHLYLNGQYWGLYFLSERPDDAFGAEHYGGTKEEYDAFKGLSAGGSTRAEIIAGDRTAWAAMYSLAAQDLTDPAKYQALQQYVDIDQLIDFNIGVLYQGDLDGPTGWINGPPNSLEPKNFYAMRRRHPDGRFRFFRWDAEFIFGSVNDDVSERNGTENPAYLHFRLRRNADYKRRFSDRVHRYFFNDGPYTVVKMKKFYLDRAAQIDKAMVAESARWGDAKREPPLTRDVHWINERNRITNSWMPGRHSVILNQFRADGLYPRVVAPVIHLNGAPRHGGVIAPGDAISLTAPAGTIYYTTDGSDPRAPEGGTTPWSPTATAASAPFSLTTTTTLKARALDNGTWSALTEAVFLPGAQPASTSNLVLSEIDYQPAAPSADEAAQGYDQRKDFEFIELLNTSTATVDLTGVAFTAGIRFNFDTQSVVHHLLAGRRLLVVKNREAFSLRYPGVDPALIAGEFSRRLSDQGDEIALRGAGGTDIARFTYDNQAPWPKPAAGDGHSLLLLRPESHPNPADPANRGTSLSGPPPGNVERRPSLAEWLAANGLTDPHAIRAGYGVSNAVVYALGADLLNDPSAALPVPAVARFTINDVTADYLTVTFIRRAGTEEARVTPQISSDLATWSSGEPAALVTVSRHLNPNGTETIVVRDAIPLSANRYIRLSVPTQ
jgi:hypothetical protein